MSSAASHAPAPPSERRTRPRVGFAGVGWIGRARLDAVAASGRVEVAAVADPDPEARGSAAEDATNAARLSSFEALLDQELDAVVIATPSAMHADQAVSALERGLAVFCQKPLGRTAAETRRVVDAARTRDLLLGVDFCYRRVRAAEAVRDLVAGGNLGEIYAADLVFHNAYGPDKAWFYSQERAGGGCLMDLGIHLVDLARWTLGFPAIDATTARLYSGGQAWNGEGVEDYVEARIDLANGVAARITCSWNLSAGQDAVIGATFYGTDGAARVRNVEGSFFDFVAERLDGQSCETLVEPPDPWGGRAIGAWAEALSEGAGFDHAIEEAVTVAETLDRLYGRPA